MDLKLAINLGDNSCFAVPWFSLLTEERLLNALRFVGMIAAGGHWNYFLPLRHHYQKV